VETRRLQNALKRWFGLAALALLVVGASEGLIALDRAQRDAAVTGFLVKTGVEYLVVWRTRADADFRAFRFESLEGARRHLGKLELVPGSVSDASLERLWIRDSGRERSLFWKTRSVPFTNRLTFLHPADAQFFFSAFEKGHYSPSPYGHAIVYSAKITVANP
jgi:hypothetical protein